MRRLTAAVVLLAACATVGYPPGGPPDEAAPQILRIVPDTNAVNVSPRRVIFQFDEVVSERPSLGAPSLEGLFLISPRDGDPSVDWDRSRLEVRPRRGWRRGVTYTVQMLPGLTDLRGNVDSLGRTIVFSTGPTIPNTVVRGIVFDWVAGRPAPNSFVQAMARPDTNLVYVTVADSVGRFELRHMQPGDYTIRAIVDQNRNRGLDPRELFDSATVTLRDSVSREMLAFVRDTLGPGIASVTRPDSLTLRIAFDRAIDTAQVVDTTLFSLRDADSTVVRIAGAMRASAFEAQREDSAEIAAREDSVRNAARADSVRRADSAAAAARPAAVPNLPRRGPSARAAAPQPAAQDSARPETPKPSVPSPDLEVVLRLAAPLAPATSYRLQARDVRSLLGHTRTSDRVFTTPRPSARDTTRARGDSAGARPTRPDSAARPVPPSPRDTSALHRRRR